MGKKNIEQVLSANFFTQANAHQKKYTENLIARKTIYAPKYSPV